MFFCRQIWGWKFTSFLQQGSQYLDGLRGMQYRTVVRPVEDMGTLKVVNSGFYSFIRTLCTNINPVRENSRMWLNLWSIHVSLCSLKVKVRLLMFLSTMKVYQKQGSKAPCINLGTRWRWVVHLTPQPLYAYVKSPSTYWIESGWKKEE